MTDDSQLPPSDVRYRVFGRDGAYDRRALRDMIRSGEVTSLSEIAVEESDEWRPASSYPELERYLSLAGSEPSTGSEGSQRKGGPLVAALVMIVIGIFFVAISAGDVTNGMATKSWPRTVGQLVSSNYTRISRSSRRSSRTYRRMYRRTYYDLHVSYRYTVEGKEHFAIRYAIGNRRWGTRLGVDTALGNVRRTPLIVSYDPANPTMSVLETGASFDDIVQLGFGLFAIGIGIVVVMKPDLARAAGRSAVRVSQAWRVSRR